MKHTAEKKTTKSVKTLRELSNVKILWLPSPTNGESHSSTLNLIERLYLANYKEENLFSTTVQLNTNLFVYSSYLEFYEALCNAQSSLNTIQAPKIVVIQDVPYIAKLISPASEIYTLGFKMDEKLRISFEFTAEEVHAYLNKNSLFSKEGFRSFTFQARTPENLNYYEHVLDTYGKVVFFEKFNQFKYDFKENRKVLETIVYKFFIGEIDKATLTERLADLEASLTTRLALKFQPIKEFLYSELADILLVCVKERDGKIVNQYLEDYKLDYFDVNYLKSFLLTFNSKQEEVRLKGVAKAKGEGKAKGKYQRLDIKGDLIDNVIPFSLQKELNFTQEG